MIRKISPRPSFPKRGTTLSPYKSLKNQYYIAFLIAAATFVVYLPSLQNEFILWDDDLYVYENPFIRSFGADFFRSAFFDFRAGNWHPLTWMSHALDYAFWELNPMGHHLTNNLLHAINTLVVVLLVVKLMEACNPYSDNPYSGNPPSSPLNLRGEKGGLPPLEVRGGRGNYDPAGDRGRFSYNGVLLAAATTGLLFGLHPVHVESVAWVSERKDLLCALFFLLSIRSYLSYVPDKSDKSYFLSLLFFILALLSKPMAVTLPLVLLLLDWYPLGRIQSLKSALAAISGKLPFIVLSLASSVVTVFAQRAGESIRSSEFASFPTRILVAAKSLVVYLRKMVLPVDLSPFYPYPQGTSPLSLEYLLAVALVTGITIACVVIAKRQKLWLAAWGYYVLTLLPVLGLVQVGLQAMADRYTYLPGLGPFLVLGVMAGRASDRLEGIKLGGVSAKVLATAASVLVIISLSYATVRQTGIWRDSITLWTFVIEREPEGAPFLYYNRALAYEKDARLNEAIADYDKAIVLDPAYHAAYNNRGMVYRKLGRLDMAIADFDKAIALNPERFVVYNNRAGVFDQVGLSDRAIADYGMVIALNPSYFSAYYNLGILYARTAQYEKAIENFTSAILLNPGYAGAYLNRGVLHARTGSRGLAASDFQKACELGSGDGCSALDLTRSPSAAR